MLLGLAFHLRSILAKVTLILHGVAWLCRRTDPCRSGSSIAAALLQGTVQKLVEVEHRLLDRRRIPATVHTVFA